jgi:ATPase family associated with various cellular activities (AAA)
MEAFTLNVDGATPPPPAPTGRRRKVEADLFPLVISLTEAAMWGQRERVADAARDLIAAIATTRPAVARRLGRRLPTELKPLPKQKTELVALSTPRYGLDSVILPANARASIAGVIAEHGSSDRLKAFRLEPRHRLLLHGPPGNGKSMLAEALAHELDVPFARVRYGGIIDSYLGETARNLDALLDWVSVAPCLLFVDEFDGVGSRRSGGKDVGEMRRVTNHLLLFLDQLPAHCVFVAATNEFDLIDKALRRRFDTTIELDAPDASLRRACAQLALAPDLTPGWNISDRADDIAALSLPSLDAVVKLCERLRRDLVLNDGRGLEDIISSVTRS